MQKIAVSPKPKRKMHPNSLKNLKPPFPPGTNGYNPGRLSLTERLRHLLAKADEGLAENATLADKLVQSTIEGALKREAAPFKEVWERVDGKVPQDVALSGGITINLVSKIPRPEAKVDDKPT